MNPSIVAGPTGGQALRWWARMARDPLAMLVELHRVYGDAVRIPFGRNRPLLVLSRPEHAEHVLVARQRNYVKAVTYRPLRAFLGSGLLTSEGEVWERHRRIVQPVFARRHLSGFAPETVAAAERRTATWRDGVVVDVADQMRALTLDVVGRVLFGTSLGASAQRIGEALALEKDIRDWIAAWNDNPKPFSWTKTADEILERLASYVQRIPGAGH